MSKSMYCIIYREKGDASKVLEWVERPIPEIASGEVRVRLMTSAVNPSDVKMRGGTGNNTAAMPFPEIIPHSDGAGIIDAVANDVTTHAVGDRVYVYNAGWKRAFGSAAEYISLPAGQVIPLPAEASFLHGACLGIPGITAAHAVCSGKSVDGGTVLVSGGGGVVGRYAVQMAKAAGAKTVIATASTALSMETARQAGADHVLNYHMDDLATAIMDATGGIDHAIESEFGVNADMLAAVLNESGSITSYGSALAMRPELPFYPLMFKNITLNMMLVYLLDQADRRRAVNAIDHWLRNHSISEHIALQYPLADTAKAHEAVEMGGKSGAVVLTMTNNMTNHQ
ncbi:MAG: NADPH:quinone reductase [Alphaproteobacteria bacterium]|jgi:NADPH:quinone reductase|nr:NADPH:quinone reductase [Alphaproteobacteria bacterium]